MGPTPTVSPERGDPKKSTVGLGDIVFIPPLRIYSSSSLLLLLSLLLLHLELMLQRLEARVVAAERAQAEAEELALELGR